MSATFTPIDSAAQQEQLAQMAHDIWFDYWPDIIGQAQTAYMVEKFQSLPAIRHDMEEHGYEYWFICAEDDGRTVGFTGGRVEEDTHRFFISKIYLLAKERGKHFASAVLCFYEDLCRARGLDAMYLTVNKHNELGIRTYTNKGFETIDSVETDIGEGYIMDDYIMEKRVAIP